MEDLVPDANKYGEELRELYGEERSLHAAQIRELNDEDLFAAYSDNREKYLSGETSNAYYDALNGEIESRLMEQRFQSPVPMPSIYAVVGKGLPGQGGEYAARELYRRISEHYSDEDLGLTEYNPPFFDGENEDSIAWKIRKDLGTEAYRRHAIIKALHDERRELDKGFYEFIPDPEPGAAPAEPQEPPDDPKWIYPSENFGLPDGKTAEDYFKQQTAGPLEEYANKYTKKNKKK